MPHEVLRAPGLAWRIFAVCLLSFLFLEHPLLSQAQTATSTSQAQIDQSNAHVSQLKSEVAQLQAQLDTTSKQKQTLQSAIEGLNLGIRKLTANTALTRVQIIQKDREINSLTGTISDTAGKVIASQKQVADSLQQLSTLDAEPLAIVLLGGGGGDIIVCF